MARDWSDLFIAEDAESGDGTRVDRRRGRSAERHAASAASSDACARAWPRRARRSGAEIQATLFGVLDEHTWERLEEALIMADVGASTTASVVGTLEAEVAEGKLEGGEALSERLIALLSETTRVGDGADRPAQPTRR